MQKILFVGRSKEPYFSQRRDMDYIFNNLKTESDVYMYEYKLKKLSHINSGESSFIKYFPEFCYWGKLNILFNFFNFIIFCISNKNKYNVVQLNYIRTEYLLIASLIRKLSSNLLILFIYGTDINKRNFIKNHFKKLFILADKIIATNPNQLELLQKYTQINFNKDKCLTVMLPQDHLQYYNNFKIEDKTHYKQKLKLPPNKTIIVVGSSIQSNEQHEKIIANLRLSENAASYFLIFPLRWSDSKQNRQKKDELEYYLRNNSFEEGNFWIIDKFMNYLDMAELRMASDIFINLRKIDQFCASLLESNMAYCQIITGSWLPYQDYTNSVSIEIIDNFNQLPETIVKIKNDKEINLKLISNQKNVTNKYVRDNIGIWLNLYK